MTAGSFSTQVLPDLSSHLESSAGSLATFNIDPSDTSLWEKYSPERFPVITWKTAPRDIAGKDTGSIYVLPRTPEGFVKIGFRGIKVTGNQTTSPPVTNASFSSLPISNLPLKERHSLRTVNGPYLCLQKKASHYHSGLSKLSSILSPFSFRSSKTLRFIPPSFVGIQTHWTIALSLTTYQITQKTLSSFAQEAAVTALSFCLSLER